MSRTLITVIAIITSNNKSNSSNHSSDDKGNNTNNDTTCSLRLGLCARHTAAGFSYSSLNPRGANLEVNKKLWDLCEAEGFGLPQQHLGGRPHPVRSLQVVIVKVPTENNCWDTYHPRKIRLAHPGCSSSHENEAARPQTSLSHSFRCKRLGCRRRHLRVEPVN